MSNSAATHTLKSHFDGKSPVVRLIYDRLLQILRGFGSFTEEPKKTSIHLVNASALAGVATRRNYLLLNIKSDHPLVSPRFKKNEQVSAGRWHQELKLTSPDEIDAELIAWLESAYHLSR